MQITDSNSSIITFIPSVVQTVAGVGKVDFIYLSDDFSGNATLQMAPSFNSFIVADTVMINIMHGSRPHPKGGKCLVYPKQYLGLAESEVLCVWYGDALF